MGFRRSLNPLANLLIWACLVVFADRFTFAHGKSNGTRAADITPINHDLYHTRCVFAFIILKETDCVIWIYGCFLIIIFSQFAFCDLCCID